jgi:L-2,4-diaminobutyrate decarboxylase
VQTLLEKAYSPAEFRSLSHNLVDLLADYLEKCQNQSLSEVIPYQKPSESLAFWTDHITKPNTDPIQLFKTVLEKSTRLHHPKYMGHQVVPPVPLAALTGFFTEFINNGMAVYEMGMAFNPIERLICEWMNAKIGYDKNANGIITSGGTLGNLTALSTARAIKTEGDIWSNGHQGKLGIIVSEEAHYCVDRAARIMGLGDEGIIKIPTNAAYEMQTELLENAIIEAKNKGIQVFAIIGSAASTSTGSHDDLVSIGNFAAKYNLWFHVDAAHGGGALFSQKYKYQLNCIETADSVVVDFHKMMLTPALATAVLYKNGKDSYETFHQKAQYLWANEEEEWQNSGKRTFECTKLGMSLKVYALLKTYGETLFEQNVDVLYDLAKSFAEVVKLNPKFELAVEPTCNIVNFRYIDSSVKDLNGFNGMLRQKLTETGEFYIVQTVLRGKTYLRVSLMNPLTKITDLEELISKLSEIAKIILG